MHPLQADGDVHSEDAQGIQKNRFIFKQLGPEV
jgi:hypothetical protein